ncbi:MAG: tetratricopeptide repeat protein [Dysgonomonas mossii]|uniref:tetratricopeptide repeat protein n=1 Tax=Dysgonomonas mossii TaxID=163665 RepID=UPI0039955AA7
MTTIKDYLHYFAYISMVLVISSCQKNNTDTTDILTRLEQTVEQNPDSVLSILDSIIPYKLNEEDYNKFILLQIQAKDKAYQNISTDTMIYKVKDYYLSTGDMKKTALSSFYCGRVLQEQNKDSHAINEFLIAEGYAERTKDVVLKGLIQSNIGSIFLKEFLETEAIKHFFKAAKYFNLANDTRNEIITYNQIGNAYLMKSVSDSAFLYYKKGFALAEISKDSLQLANITQCIGIAYRQTGNFDLAVEYFRNAAKYIGNNDYRAKLYLNLSKTFYERGVQDSAKFYINESLSIAQNDDINLLANIHKTFSQIAEKQGDYDQSLISYKEYASYLEQIVDENKNTEILKLQRKYKYEQVQNENNLLKIKEQRLFLIFAIIIVLLGLVAIFFYKKYLDSKRNALENENKILDAEKKIYQLIEMSNSYDDRENSIKSILFHHFDILKKAALLKQSLKNEDQHDHRLLIVRKVNEIIYGQDFFNWEIFYQDMNGIHDGRFERLKLKHILDETEFRICCLTYANLTCSEIGIILDLSPNTVQMKRSSIRKKLGIEAQGNIQTFIDSEI